MGKLLSGYMGGICGDGEGNTERERDIYKDR